MSRAYFYLTLHDSYAEYLGGLRWALDAIEEEDGTTFALSAEVAALLEGVVSCGRPLHFAPVLHLLHLLGRGKKAPPSWARELRDAFARSGKSLGNAGAFFGSLLDVPRVAAPLDVGAVLRRLRGVPPRGEDLSTFDEEPPLSPSEFEDAVRRAIDEQTRASLEHWLETGRPPVRADRVADEVARIPRSLEGALATALARPRLAGSVPFVAPLVSALALPRRALANPELPLGGYVDVTTRGGFDQILVSQLVLDDLEFVRRFAANELLYYRREEPHRERHEELVLLVDQGARTWGFVRVVLAAACVAFGKSAARRKLPFLVATTASGGTLVDPLEVKDGALAELLEGSDLSRNPGLALEALLEAPGKPGRDVVLLTHARSVSSPDVLAAARRLRDGTRLFAVGVADDGSVALSELRHGAPVVRSRCRVDPQTGIEKRAEPRTPTPSRAGPYHPWRGDVEPIGFPFRFGLTGTLRRAFDFDRSGTWVLVSGRNGMLHAARTDGSRFEILPRGIVSGPAPLADVTAIFGTSDGFVVVGAIHQRSIAVHYDFARRAVKTFALVEGSYGSSFEWFHFPELRSVVVRHAGRCHAVDLDVGGDSARTKAACAAVVLGEKGADQRVPLELDASGELALGPGRTGWSAFTPLADGLAELAKQRVVEARLAGQVLGATFASTSHSDDVTLRLYRGPAGSPLGAYPTKPSGSRFALSPDGAFVVREIGASRLEVRETAPAGHIFSFPTGRFHHDVTLEGGAVWLTIRSGRYSHVVRWHDKVLRAAVMDSPATGKMAVRVNEPPGVARYDPQRFSQVLFMNVIAVVDIFGQVVILDREGARVLAILFAYRRQFAAWMPDGTRFGSTALLDGPPTPGAAEHIGTVLLDACVAPARKEPA